MVKKKEDDNSGKKKRRKRAWIITFIIIGLILLIFGTRFYLLFNFLIGNDTLITIKPDSENIALGHGEIKNMEFKISVLANPFCVVECNYTFEDLSNNEIFDKGEFKAKTTSSVTKNYNIKSPNSGVGQILYRFDTQCFSRNNGLCHTSSKPYKKSMLLTMDYNYTESENNLRDEIKEDFYGLQNENNEAEIKIYKLNQTLWNISFYGLDNREDVVQEIVLENNIIRALFNDAMIKWDLNDYSGMMEETENANKRIILLKDEINELNESILDDIEEYNIFVANISEIQKELENYRKNDMTNSSGRELDRMITNFNSLKDYFNSNKTLLEKRGVFNGFNGDYDLFKGLLKEEDESGILKDYKSKISLNEVQNSWIYVEDKVIDFNREIKELKDSSAICCLNKKCEECCDDSCYSNESLYPVIFLHGHDFSAGVSSEYNLEIFQGMQRELEKEGYINAGFIIVNAPEYTQKGVLGKSRNPVSLSASYYFEVIKNETDFSVLETKKDSIDSYAIRLDKIIESVKKKTNKEKVIIISHSMGGLVTRRYIEVFGEENLDKVIMIATPNHGMDSQTLFLCKIFGAGNECEDMDSKSLFMNQLNYQEKPSIEIHNIVGIGCDTNGEDGDGVIKKSSAYLEFATNHYIKGKCEGVNYLHTRMIYPDEYPQTYETIVEILKEE